MMMMNSGVREVNKGGFPKMGIGLHSAMKANLSLSSTVHGCLDQALLVSPYMVPFLITNTTFVRSFFLPKIGGWFLPK
ncbi:hypothetical protein Q3G72_027915 [Acer saccharum]|nr:hypothetical protein Q3G72_027915 [Acer saccharum]